MGPVKRAVQAGSVLAIAAVLLGLTACGDSSDESATAPATNRSLSTGAAPTAKPAEDRKAGEQSQKGQRQGPAKSAAKQAAEAKAEPSRKQAKQRANKPAQSDPKSCGGNLSPQECAAALELSRGDRGGKEHPVAKSCSARSSEHCAELGQVEHSDSSQPPPSTSSGCPPNWAEDQCRLAEKLAQRGSG